MKEKTKKSKKTKKSNKYSKKVNPTKSFQRRMPARNKRMVAECLGVDNMGNGIVKINEQDVAVPNLLKGERAIIEIINKPKYTTGKVVKIKKSSMLRSKPKCVHAASCGGCQIQHMNKDAQKEFKQNIVKSFLGKYGKVNDIIAMEDPYNYRNKIHATFKYGKDKKIISGMYEQFSHWVIEVEQCYIQDSVADKILATIRSQMNNLKIMPYDEDSGEGFLRHVLIRTGFNSKQVMVVLVASTIEFPKRNNFISALLKKHPEITTIVLNINNEKTNLVLGKEQSTLYGKGYIEDSLLGCKFQISPKSFYQVNPIQTEKLYNKVIEMAEFKQDEVVLDAYSGIGTIGLIISNKVKQVLGVDLSRAAIKDARNNAEINGIKNVRFYQGDAGKFMLDRIKDNKKIDTIILDPPRSGSDEKFLSSLGQLKPNKVIYISCNPETQARDISQLVGYGYEVKEIQPVDMFPQTVHVECVVRLEKQ
ncbi:23S rRNA (uracil(1939)-C(5))-methyltransferase RlmD [Clostridium sp. 'deep sea']|uniref:23S rRNA (uracil(1939)-C(5))-methyltransferase RlmD n=1 Tax=Clostridium sp. 'deep sea' TaxID=2779445 RepID=UPI001FAE354D|nr:23S rRNA (uracil(1939)-C(5))-methyltransferase RlmD [Clostridium sp. 'deep sea']